MLTLKSLADFYQVQVKVGKIYKKAKKANNKKIMKDCENFFNNLQKTYRKLYLMEKQKTLIKKT